MGKVALSMRKYKDAIENVQRRAPKQLPGMKDIPTRRGLRD